MDHHLTVTVEVRLDLTVPTGVGPEQVARTIANRASKPFGPALGVTHRKDPEVTLGAWHLTGDDGSFTGRLG